MLLPPTDLGVSLVGYDKLVHFLMFGIWTFLFGIARAVRKKSSPNLLVVFILGSAYGLLIELLQFAVPTNRSPEMLDFIADMLGSAAAIVLLYFLFKRVFRQEARIA